MRCSASRHKRFLAFARCTLLYVHTLVGLWVGSRLKQRKRENIIYNVDAPLAPSQATLHPPLLAFSSSLSSAAAHVGHRAPTGSFIKIRLAAALWPTLT